MFELNYNGVFIQPHRNKLTSTMAYLTNEDNKDLILFLLSPGLFQDAYKLASNPSFRNVYILSPSMDSLFISDIIRLQNDLSDLKNICKVIFPVKPNDEKTNVIFKNNFIKRNSILLKNEFEMASIKYLKTPIENVYNIHLSLSTGGYVLSSFIDEHILNELENDSLVNEIHLFYTTSLYGGFSFKDIKLNNELEYKPRKIRCNGFLNTEELKECKNIYESLIVKSSYKIKEGNM